MKAATNGKASGRKANEIANGPNLAAGWAKLARVLAAVGNLRREIDAFLANPDGRALALAADIEGELSNLSNMVEESAGIFTDGAARAAVGG